MSIIQDALKKAQAVFHQNSKPTALPHPPVRNPSPVKKVQPVKLKAALKPPKAAQPHLSKYVFILVTTAMVILIFAVSAFVYFKLKAAMPVKEPVVKEPAKEIIVEKPAQVKPKPEFFQSSLEVRPLAIPKNVEPVEESSAETPVAEEKTRKALTPPIPELTLNGVFYSPEDAHAIINNRIVRVGEYINGARVEEILENYVRLRFYDLELVLRLK